MNFNATLLAQIVDFLILLILLRLVAWKPLVNALEERRKLVADNIAAAEQEKQEAARLRAEYEAEMRRAREQAQEIIQQATKNSEEQARRIVEAAKQEADRIKEGALQEIASEKERALAELRDQVATLSVLVAGKIIEENITAGKQHSLIKEFIDNVGELPC